ncbi:peptidase [Longimycelium tulufanense]|uniref:Peptidase n=1 Tax=Longimycelium tulufanense TaxID=907463 RepID=A0A8J3C8P4_9PSEU|nr:alpha/beta hydrolase [Longimycelium tulufanense]GGM55953.1 peptidase [Longimycelium tulufanense]
MPRAAIRAAALLLPVALVALVSCTVGPSREVPVGLRGDGPGAQAPPPTGSAARPVPELEESTADLIDWSDCTELTKQRLGNDGGGGAQFRCGRLSVPLDPPERPGRGFMRLSLLKVGNGRVPLLVVNDTDGEPGTLHAARLASRMPEEMLRRFTLVGVDRRGTGGSNAPECVPDEQRHIITSFDPLTRDPERLQDLLDALRRGTQQCLLDLETNLSAFDAWRAAGDLDRVREALGVSRVNALASGTGSRVLTTYAHRFPSGVGRFVLDGVPDPTTDAVGRAEARAAAAERALDEFARDCVARGCPLGGDPKRAVHSLLDRLRGAPSSAGDVPVTAGTAIRALLAGLADRPRWPGLAESLAKAGNGDGSGIAAAVQPLVMGDGERAPTLDGIWMNSCNDTPTRVSFDRISALAGEWQQKYPTFGGYLVQTLMACSVWPQAKPLPPLRSVDAPPMVVVGTAVDPVTPLPGATHAAGELAGSVLVSWQGSGHGAFPTSPCVTTAVQRFLLDGTVPVNGMNCPP